MTIGREDDRRIVRDILNSNHRTANIVDEQRAAAEDERLMRLRSPVAKAVESMRADLPQATEEAQRAVEYAQELRELIPTSRIWKNRMAHGSVVRYVEELESMPAAIRTAEQALQEYNAPSPAFTRFENQWPEWRKYIAKSVDLGGHGSVGIHERVRVILGEIEKLVQENSGATMEAADILSPGINPDKLREDAPPKVVID